MLTNVTVQIRGCEVDAALRAHFDTKLHGLERLWSRLDDAQVRVSCERGQHVAEITLFAGGLITRAEERDHDLRAAFDAAVAKLQTQLARYKDKVQHRSRRHNNRDDVNGVVLHPKHSKEPLESATLSALEHPVKPEKEQALETLENENSSAFLDGAMSGIDGNEAPDTLVRVKQFALKPMSPDEAALQMDLLGHSFFVFRNGKTNGVGVVYLRSSGGYGLIEPVAD